MNLLKLIPDRGWAKYHEHNQLLLAKTVFTMDDKVYVIGGAKDQKAKDTISALIEHTVTDGKISITNKAPMITSRASFGSLYSAGRNEIFVAGGYEKGEIVKKCERYSVAENKWYSLPD